MTTETAPAIDPNVPLREVLAVYPGARRALFRKYHVGGCASCGFSEEETLAQICARNEQMSDVAQVREYLQASQEADRQMQLSPRELYQEMENRPEEEVRLLDIRSRQEFETVHIEGSYLFSQEVMQKILTQWPRNEGLFVIIDHKGARSLDAAGYFAGQGFSNVRALLGGIDAWSREADPSVPQYEIEVD